MHENSAPIKLTEYFNILGLNTFYMCLLNSQFPKGGDTILIFRNREVKS